MQEDYWADLSFVERSKERFAVLKALNEPKTPTQIKKETKMQISRVSRALSELEKRGLVKCLTPKEVRGRYYKITDRGEKILG